MQYILNTEAEKKEMLADIGVKDVMDLFADIDPKLIQKNFLNITPELPEIEVKKKVENLSKKNKLMTSFLGAGYYSHYIPSVINHILLRSEFYTAYTPYQPEMSQGALQSIFEFQTFICKLTGMDVANASMYDGSSALAEAAAMAHSITKKNKILVAKTVHPEYKNVIKTYCRMSDSKYLEVDYHNGITDVNKLKEEMDENTACFIVQNPNFFGSLEEIAEIEKIVHKQKALLINSIVEATSLGIVKAPSSADIVVGEGQTFGIPISYGGPAFGFMAVKKEFMRRLPGRLVGETLDTDGKKGYIMTLQAREQHIRREKAFSNICTNQALLALGGTVFLSMMGKQLKNLANLNMQKAKYAFDKISNIDSFEPVFNSPFYNEFVVKCENSKEIINKLKKENIVAGLDLGKYYPELENHLLICVTEIHTKEDIDSFVEKLK